MEETEAQEELEGQEAEVDVVQKPPRRLSRENYRLITSVRSQALRDIGVLEKGIVADLFACKHNATHHMFISKVMEAFRFDWTKLRENERDIFWAHPPFTSLD